MESMLFPPLCCCFGALLAGLKVARNARISFYAVEKLTFLFSFFYTSFELFSMRSFGV
jgi:hypothetical protein